MNSSWPEATNFNQAAYDLCREAIGDGERLEVIQHNIAGAVVLDFATGRTGTCDAGKLLANICLGGAAKTELSSDLDQLGLCQVHVDTPFPVAACIGAQLAGWPVTHEKYFAMCSGPIRLLRGKESILTQYSLPRRADMAVGVLESNKLPTESVVKLIADECRLAPEKLTLCVARTASYPGSVQVVARSVETALHKLHELQFDLASIVAATGQAPLPPIPDDDMTALGWTNDSMLYGASVSLTVNGEDSVIEAIIDQVPSCSSAEFGTPFLELFKRYDYDFYKIDKMLFSPAEIQITNGNTGRVFSAGERRFDILKTSFGIE